MLFFCITFALFAPLREAFFGVVPAIESALRPAKIARLAS
jgi:hypothetical protein